MQNMEQAKYDRLLEKVTDMFNGDRQAAIDWVKVPLPALGGKCMTEVDEDLADQVIGQIEYGVFS